MENVDKANAKTRTYFTHIYNNSDSSDRLFFKEIFEKIEMKFIFSIEKEKLTLQKRARADVHSVKPRVKKTLSRKFWKI